MAKRRTTKKRLDVIEKDLGDVKKQVTNDIPHKLDALEKADQGIYEKVCKNEETNKETLEVAKEMAAVISKYTGFK